MQGYLAPKKLPFPYRGTSLIRNCPPVAVGSNAPPNYTWVHSLPYFMT